MPLPEFAPVCMLPHLPVSQTDSCKGYDEILPLLGSYSSSRHFLKHGTGKPLYIMWDQPLVEGFTFIGINKSVILNYDGISYVLNKTKKEPNYELGNKEIIDSFKIWETWKLTISISTCLCNCICSVPTWGLLVAFHCPPYFLVLPCLWHARCKERNPSRGTNCARLSLRNLVTLVTRSVCFVTEELRDLSWSQECLPAQVRIQHVWWPLDVC